MSREIIANQITAVGQEHPDIAATADGGFILTWDSYLQTDDYDTTYVASRSFDAGARAITAESVVYGTPDGASVDPHITALPDGGHTIVFAHSNDGILGQKAAAAASFTGSGASRGVWNADSIGLDDIRIVDVATSPTGRQLAVFSGTDPFAGSFDDRIYGRWIGRNGQPIGEDFAISGHPRHTQDDAEIVTLANGNLLVSWQLGFYKTEPVTLHDTYATILSPSGRVIRDDFRVAAGGDEAAAAGLSTGGFALVHNETRLGDHLSDPSAFGFTLQLFNARGNATSRVIDVAFIDSVPRNADVVQLVTGEIVVAWQQSGTLDAYDDVVGRIFDANGRALSGVFNLAEYRWEEQEAPRLAALTGGGFAATWTSYGNDGEDEGIAARTFGSGTAGNDRLNAGALHMMAGLAGNDRVLGTPGADHLYGNAGNDVLVGRAGADLLSGGLGSDRLTGGAGADTFVFDRRAGPGNVDTITDFDARADTIVLDDAIFSSLRPGVLRAAAFHASTSGTAHDPNDRILYDTTSGEIFYDADGWRRGPAVHIATLTDHPALGAADFLII